MIFSSRLDWCPPALDVAGWAVRLLVVAAAAAPLGAARAQAPSAAIRGIVRATGVRTPIEGARVLLRGTPHARVTDAQGKFSFPELVPGRYVIQASAIGYSSLSSPIEVKEAQLLEIEFEAESETVRLPELSVEADRNHGPMDWIRRKAEGRGRYVTRAEIEKRNAATVPDMLRSMAGVRIECRTNVVCLVRMARAPRGCNPAFFMDGIPTEPAVAWLTPISEIEGIEVYSGPAETPPELESYRARCGVVVLWTRAPPPRQPKPKKDKKKPPADSLGDSLRVAADTTKAAGFLF